MDTLTISTWFTHFSPTSYPWLWEVFAIICGTLLASYIVKRLLATVKRRLEKTKNLWDDAMLDAAHKPAYYAIGLLGFSWVLNILDRSSGAMIWTTLAPAREVLIIVLLTWYIVRAIKQIEKRVTSAAYTDKPADQTTVSAIAKLLRVAAIITAGLIVLQNLGFSISGVLAFGGIGGIAVGFAAKDLLANFFGGLVIFLDRPFAMGDWIRSPDQEIEGTVEKIGWRQTVIRTFDKRPLYVPNATFTHIAVENPSRMSNRRIKETLGIRYEDAAKMPAVIAAVKTMLEQHPEIDTRQTLIVNFDAFAPSSLDFFIYTFTKTTNWIRFHEIKQDVLLKVLAIVEQQGAEAAYPTSTLKLSDPIVMKSATKG